MKTEPHIVWKGIDSSPALDARIRQELGELDKAYDRITSCRVVVEQPHRHHQKGGHFQVKIEVNVPGQVLTVSRDPVEHDNAKDPYASVNEAFFTMRRQLEDYIRIKRG